MAVIDAAVPIMSDAVVATLHDDHLLAVFKQDGTLIQIPHNYGWVEGAFEEALEEARRLWREKDQTR